MEYIVIESFDHVTDPVKTEQTISEQLIKRSKDIKTDKIYISFPIAWNLNNKGIGYTQNVINSICEKYKNKNIFFVCQHILVNNLNFHNNLVFTPHATILDPYVAIPHYTCNYDLNYVKPWNEREYLFSFVGSFRTHPVRQRLYQLLKHRNDCYIVDTGAWHFENSKQTQIQNSNEFSKILGNTKYSLCPRGTGPSTIRIWESMAMGSYPVILSDILKMPMSRQFSDELWLQTPEDLINFETSLGKSEYNNSSYFGLFSNENLYKSIEENL